MSVCPSKAGIPGPYDHSCLMVITDSEATLLSWRPGVWGTCLTLAVEAWPSSGALACLCNTPTPDFQHGSSAPDTQLSTWTCWPLASKPLPSSSTLAQILSSRLGRGATSCMSSPIPPPLPCQPPSPSLNPLSGPLCHTDCWAAKEAESIRPGVERAQPSPCWWDSGPGRKGAIRCAQRGSFTAGHGTQGSSSHPLRAKPAFLIYWVLFAPGGRVAKERDGWLPPPLHPTPAMSLPPSYRP